jgi:hydrogenase maturation protein HypF
VREPRRSALSLLYQCVAGDLARLEPLARSLGFDRSEIPVLFSMLERGFRAPVTTSAGRLFDGVAALLGLCSRSTFEGQAAMEVEFAADPETQEEGDLIAPITASDRPGGWQIDWRPVVGTMMEHRSARRPGVLAARFHGALARAIVEVAGRAGIGDVILTGGCFQNIRLLDSTRRQLHTAGFNVLCHRDLPPNDGGISAGQALGALWGITSVSTESARAV